MKREEYNACISKNLSGKQLGKEERKVEFCIVAKLCSGKAKSREEAQNLCEAATALKSSQQKGEQKGEEACICLDATPKEMKNVARTLEAQGFTVKK